MPNESTGERLLARRYRLVTQVGRGGMGTVWQAHDEVLGRDVAVKEVILPHGLTDEERTVHHKRTFREARTAARLGHPGVVTVYDVVEEDDRPWIIMELIKSRSLDQVIKQEGPMEPRRAAEIGRQMLAALHAAHDAGVLHRDVKPSNVLVTATGRAGDRAVLTDFGIATASGDATLTQTGLVMGSPAYIAPERARGRVAGPASDLWSLGVTLYAMVHGKSPFERAEPMAALVAVISDEPDPPERGGPLVPVIEGLLRKNPDLRMDAIEAGALLDEIVRQESVDTQRTMAVEFPLGDLPGATRATPLPDVPDPDEPGPGPAGSGTAGAVGTGEGAPGDSGGARTGGRRPGRRSGNTRPGGGTRSGGTRSGGTRSGIGVSGLDPGARPDQLTRFDVPPGAVTPPPGAGAPDITATDGGASVPPAIPSSMAGLDPTAPPGATVPDGPSGTTPREATREAWGNEPATRPAGSVLPPVPPPAAPAARPGLAALGANRNAVIIGVVVLVIILVIAGIALASSGDDKGGKPAGMRGNASPRGRTAPASPTPAKPSGTPSPTLPSGYRMYHDHSGYTVPVPAGWSGPERKQGGDFYYAPGRRTYVQIDQTGDPGPSAIDDWRRQEKGARFGGYHRIKIEPTGDEPPVPDTGNGDKSADWEFTFQSEDGGRTHILNRGFVANGRGYAILVRSPDDGWSGAIAELEPVFRFFEPAK
ncbi:serine/threonine-protein kinase [Actinomadura roseirufa]|uniref:serine/threonine-protein kinase n=1 Tax=Actinomadura roseirufa TaxID=2094049 RepID=UPI001F5E3D79|nr:serine/threonine-protein kinase [Actinomadura roseirufa]